MSECRERGTGREADPVGWIVPERGEACLRTVVHAFYQRVPDDDLLGPMYPEYDLDGAEQRLADFLVERCGGPPYFSEKRGHPRLRMRHAKFAIDEAARDRWLQVMRDAIAEVRADGAIDDEVIDALDPFLAHVADFLRNRP